MPKLFSGPRLIFSTAVVLAVYLVTAFLLAGGYTEALPLVMWPTAHAAFLLFVLAFTASSIQRLFPSPYGRWAMRNRRYIGLSFALVHFVHAALVLSNLALTPEDRPLHVLAVGGLAYVFLLLMTLTSNNAAVSKLGAKNWKRLHKIGSYYIWAIFLGTSMTQPDVFTSMHTSWVPLVAVFALVLRIQAYRKTARK